MLMRSRNGIGFIAMAMQCLFSEKGEAESGEARRGDIRNLDLFTSHF